MNDQTGSGDVARVQSLEAEVLAMRQQVALRDELLRSLNRRLLQLERGEVDAAGMRRIESQALRDEQPLPGKQPRRDESTSFRWAVRSLLDTDMFRWTLPARRLRGKIHARRRGPA